MKITKKFSKNKALMIKNNYVAMSAMCRDRIEYIEEWLDYHLSIGVQKIILYDNLNEIPLSVSLEKYIKSRKVDVIDWNRDTLNYKQIRAQNHCVTNYQQFRWIGFLDIDEFVVLLEESTDIKTYLKEYDEHDALGLHWLLFGSNSHKARQKSVLNSYTQSCPNSTVNRHIKSFVNPRNCIISDYRDPHFIPTKKYTVNVRHERVYNAFGTGNAVIDYKMRINHYYTRSEEDYFIDKKNRGGGVIVNRVYNKIHFNDSNRENVFNDDILKTINRIGG